MIMRSIVCCLMLLAIAGCASDEPPPAPLSFAPLHYEYLNKIRLNVGSIDVQDSSAPLGTNDVANQAPTPLAQAATRMAHDRLFAAGLTGQANFVIDQANIVRGPNGALDGLLAIHLVLFNAQGVQIGSAQARVTREHLPGSDPENQSAVLYDMTKQMLDDMNVELEFQIRRSLSNFLVTSAPLPAAVTQAPLDSPALPPPPPPPPPEDGAPPPQQMSPPPGFLQLPPGTPQ